MKPSTIKHLVALVERELHTTNPTPLRWSPEIYAAAEEQIRERKSAVFTEYQNGEITEEEFVAKITSLNSEVPLLYQQMAQNESS